MTEEQRRAARRLRTLKRAMIGFHGQFSSCPCVIRDMSETGARIELEQPIALPRHFTLHVEIDGFKVECELIWQNPSLAGVHFTSERQHTSIARKQVLRPSESALSEQFMREEAERQRRAAAGEQPLLYRRQRPVGKQPVAFGKRKFEG